MSIDRAILNFIKTKTNLSEKSITNTIQLFDEGASIPFISRYRKEMTGSLDEVQVELIQQYYSTVKDLISRKEYIINIIKEQGELTPKLQQSIQQCWDPILLEDLYLPYKRKKKTRGTIAKNNGLEPLANLIFWSKTRDIERSAQQFITPQVTRIEDALAGARDIIAENISEHKVAREITRDIFKRTATFDSKVIKSKEKEAEKYKNYFSFNQSLSKVPSHRLLAIYRGEEEKYLRVKIEIDGEKLSYRIENYFIKHDNECADQVKQAIQDSLKRLIVPSISNEFRKAARAKADDEAIDVFSENLRQLLLAPPLGEKPVLTLDPGFRSGCKVAVLDQQGSYQHNTTIFPHPPINKKQDAEHTILSLIAKYNIETIAIGNGTAGRESIQWLKSFTPSHVENYLVNESGASIYSASAIARQEFPDLDLTVRGAISIGRRLQDPLAELVKIDAKSIGVGQYQHDVNQTKLKNKLDQTVINCVNKVGVNINTASEHLLAYVSGLGPTLAQNIVKYRNENHGIKSRIELKKVARMGAKSFEQSAGFLKITDAKNPLDNTAVHPESYRIVKNMASDLNISIQNLIADTMLINKININQYTTDKIGLPTLKDIIEELKKPGLDPRGAAKVFHFTKGINDINDLKSGMELKGIVNNLTKFGAFVDVGIKESALIHISQITNKFIKDPSEVLSLGQEVKAMIMDVDVSRKRISLTLKF